MKHRARVTSKGQITLPVRIRRDMGIRAGDTVEFDKVDADYRVRAVRKVSPFAKYQGIGNPGMPRGKKAILRYIRKMRGE